MEKPIYSLKEEKLAKYIEKFNNKKPSDDNGGDSDRASSDKCCPKG